MKLYLIRHAKPALNEYKGFPGPSLGSIGQEQAAQIASYLSDKGIEQVFSSDYTRVLETYAPFGERHPQLQPQFYSALREREKEVEPHESLLQRVHTWYLAQEPLILSKTTAIFSHCGPINMILEYLDPDKQFLDYPYTCPFGCHTPLAGVWVLEVGAESVMGELAFVAG